MSKIKIEGTSQTYPLSEVEDSVIQLSGNWYWRDDTKNLTKVNGRYYRKASPLIVFSETTQTFELKSKCVKTKDGLWLVIDNPNTIKIENEYYKKSFCTLVKGNYYVKSDPRLVRCYYSKDYTLKLDAIKLSDNYYDSLYVSNAYLDTHRGARAVVKLDNGDYVFSGDAITIIDADGNITCEHHTIVAVDGNYTQVCVGFNKVSFGDSSVRDIGRLLNSLQSRGYTHSNNLHRFKSVQSLPLLVHDSKEEEALNNIKSIIDTHIKPAVQQIKQSLSYSDYDPNYPENTAEIISFDGRRFRGNEILYSPTKSQLELSEASDLDLTFGSKYTFGVEIETAAGLVDDKKCEKHSLIKVGDGSISSAEYVTKPLHGNKGINYLKSMLMDIKDDVFVNDNCAIHVHIGGANSKLSPSPVFGAKQLLRIVRLGCAIEEDLFKILPPSRTPFKKHCHSIKRYRKIEQESVNNYIGHYVFGPEQSWQHSAYLNDYVYESESYNNKVTLGNYCGGRYKWLNLVNACTNTKHSTLEFRIFGGSTNFEKVYYQLLICLAFMEVVNNDKITLSSIDKMTLDQLIVSAFGGDLDEKDPCKDILSFIKNRKAFFNRKSLYSPYNNSNFPTFNNN